MTTQEILKAARAARPALMGASTDTKNAALLSMADSLWARRGEILAANAQDLEAAHTGAVLLDRLALTEERIAGMAEGVRQVAAACASSGEARRRSAPPMPLRRPCGRGWRP